MLRSGAMIALRALPHPEARRLASSGAPVYLAANPLEYHGPHLSLENDALVSAGLVRDLHAALAPTHPEWPLLWAGELGLGVDPVPGPGSVATSFDALRAALARSCRGLLELGARRVVLVTFHGSPMHSLALEAGCAPLRAAGVQLFAPMHLLLEALIRLDERELLAPAYEAIADPDERAAAWRELPNDFHAGFGETSLALHYAPASVDPRYRSLPPCPAWEPVPWVDAAARAARSLGRDALAEELAFAARGLGWYRLRPFPGYSARPALASPEAGARVAAALTARFAEAAAALFARGATPRPAPMRWLRALSLDGRILSRQRIPEDAIARLL